MGYAYLTLQHVRAECPTAEKVDFVVSRKGKITDHIKFFHEELRKFAEAHDPTLAELVGTLIPADMEDRVPLQAADVFCWHIRRRYEEGTERKYKCRSTRWTKEDLEALAANLLTP